MAKADLWSVGLLAAATTATAASILLSLDLFSSSGYVTSKLKTGSYKPSTLYNIIGAIANFNFKVKYGLSRLFSLKGDSGGFVSKIIVYPIKSVGKGVEANSWEVSEFGGFKFDREFVLASIEMGKKKGNKESHYLPITQREKPNLSLIDVKFIKTSQGEEPLDGIFRVTYPLKDSNGTKSFDLPAVVTDSILYPETKVLDVFGAIIDSFVIKDILPDDFNYNMDLPEDTLLFYSFTGRPVKTGSPLRSQLQDVSEDSEFRHTTFHDYYPVLLFSQDDIDHLQKSVSSNEKYKDVKIYANQFRPNMVIQGTKSPHDTDNWSSFAIHSNKTGDVNGWKVGSKCARCPLPNVNIVSGEMDKRYPITNTISKYRRVNPEDKVNSFFGIYAIQLNSGYFINVGDYIEVTGRQYIPFVDPIP